MNSNQQANDNNSENIFKPSKFLTLRRMAHTKTQPNTTSSQIQTTKNESTNRTVSEDKKPKLIPNSKSARRRDLSSDQAQFDPTEDNLTQKKTMTISKKNLLFSSKKEEGSQKNVKSQANQKITTSIKGVVFGGGKIGTGLSNSDKKSKIKSNLFNENLSEENLYKGRNFLFPIDVKTKSEEEKVAAILEHGNKLSKDQIHEKEIIDSLVNEFCFFQLPANLPLEGCCELTPKTENPDFEINTDDLLLSFLSNKFDSTGFYLERDFKLFKEKSQNKMVEEKDLKRGIKDKIPQDKNYDTYHIGKLCRMKNGGVKLRIGNNFFDITQGVQDSFYKELFVIDYTDKSATSLFPIDKKFVVKPNMESFY